MHSAGNVRLSLAVFCMLSGVVAPAPAQERYEVAPMAKGKEMGVGAYRVERRAGTTGGNDYSIEILDASLSPISSIAFTARFTDPSVAVLSNARTGARVQVRYGPGFRWVEVKDLVTGVAGRSEFVDPGKGKPSFKKDAAFLELQRTRADDFNQLFEALAAVQSANARNLREQQSTGHAVVKPIAWQQSYCQGGECRGVSYGMARSICCSDARQAASNCCGMNRYCIGCCRFGSCDAYCSFGDYACPICGVTGFTCSGGH